MPPRGSATRSVHPLPDSRACNGVAPSSMTRSSCESSDKNSLSTPLSRNRSAKWPRDSCFKQAATSCTDHANGRLASGVSPMDPGAARFVAELSFAASSRGVSGCEVAPDRTKVATPRVGKRPSEVPSLEPLKAARRQQRQRQLQHYNGTAFLVSSRASRHSRLRRPHSQHRINIQSTYNQHTVNITVNTSRFYEKHRLKS